MSAPAESFYTSSPTQPTHNPTSPGAPPPPPPKPAGHIASNDPSRSGTPLSYSQQHQQQPPIPPQPAQYTASPPPVPPAPSSSHYGPPVHPSTPQQSHQQQVHHIPPPSHAERWLPSSPDLTAHTIPDLTSILSNPQLLTALSQTHPSYNSSLSPLLALLSQNVALAQQLQQTEQHLRSERDKTGQLMLNHTSLQQQWRRKQSEMDDALSPWQPRAMYQRLVASITEQEAVLRALHESFLDGDGADEADPGGRGGDGGGKASDREVAEWIRRIREGTTTLERRRELKNRWDEGRVGGFR